MKTTKILPIIIITGVLLTGCQESKTPTTEQPTPSPTAKTQQKKETPKQEKTQKGITVKITAAGNNYITKGILQQQNFDVIYKNLKDVLKESDINIVSNEAVITTQHNKVSPTTPMGMPYQSGEALAKAGFNLICQATNHSFDLGSDGVKSTVSFWNNMKNIDMIGMHDSEKSFNHTYIKEVNGIKIAFLNYTVSLGGNNMHTDEKFYVKTLYNEKTIKKDIEKAKKKADFVIVLPHWGKENSDEPDELQIAWSRCFVDSGADLIIGTGPLKAQPLEFLLSQDGKEVPCYYSLGNLVSDEKDIKKVIGILADITLEKVNNKVTISKCTTKGIISDKRYGNIAVLPVENYNEEMAKNHFIKDQITLEKINSIINGITMAD